MKGVGSNMKIGVVGKGFVGTAMAHTHPGARFYDPNVEGSVGSLQELAEWATALYICVPTPMATDGSCDASVVINTLKELVHLEYSGLVIVKSTTPYFAYGAAIGRLKICFIPEFLRGAHAVEDYQKTEYFIVGCESLIEFIAYKMVIRSSTLLYSGSLSYFHMTIKEAVCLKYFENSYLAAKVTLFNEFYLYCEAEGIDYEKVIAGLTRDKRIPDDHTTVPGPDGKYGWGGHCLPKDVNALLAQAKDIDCPMPMLSSVVEINKEHREL